MLRVMQTNVSLRMIVEIVEQWKGLMIFCIHYTNLIKQFSNLDGHMLARISTSTDRLYVNQVLTGHVP